jgi:UDP-galactopyranose mutase
VDSYQSRYVVNYPADPKMTRITEYKKLSQQEDDSSLKGITAIGREYPGQYREEGFDVPYYPIFKKESSDVLPKYFEEADKIENLIYIGRLAENKYKQM